KLSRSLNYTHDTLPPVARKQFLLECLVEELYNTNELEGVKSTKKEIARSTREAQLNKKTNTRFNSMARLYLRLEKGDISLPQTPNDIRVIYDAVTKGEIDSKESPDGDTFRQDTTYIYKKSGSGKIIHRSEEHTSELQSRFDLVCRLLLE